MKKILLRILPGVFTLYILLCCGLYFFQEKLLFFPQKLGKDFRFEFDQPFAEQNIHMGDGTLLNGILFKADRSKGVILYLHGNGGCLASWGNVAQTYTGLNYDVFMLDYRGYGKSEGAMQGQAELFDDVQTVYTELKKHYSENNIIVLGYSIGSGPAAKIASANNPKLLILQAPYYSLTDMMRHTYSFIPTFILKYPLETNVYLKDCKMPVVIFHGTEDEVIYYGSSLKLQETFKPSDTLITLNGQRHNGMTGNPDYQTAIEKLLAKD